MDSTFKETGKLLKWVLLSCLCDSGKACSTGFNNTGKACISSVINSGIAFVTGVNDTGEVCYHSGEEVITHLLVIS